MIPEPTQPALPGFDFSGISGHLPDLGERLKEIFFTGFYWLQVVALFLSLFLLIGIIYSVIRINQIRKAERAAAGAVSNKGVEREKFVPDPLGSNPRWDHIKKLIDSNNEGDWRVAIIEADIMLADMVERMQYPGETLGEKLKGIEKSDFNTIDNAWEAHKIRNQIAHEGSDFNLTKREAKRAIALFESVFKEFRYI